MKFVLSLFVVKAVHYGGAKTNAPPRSIGGPIVQPALSEAERMAANWNVRGAWKDSFWLDFDGGWVFQIGRAHV